MLCAEAIIYRTASSGGTFFRLSGDVDVDMTRDLTPAEQSVVAEAFATGDQRSRNRRVQYCAAGRARARQMLVE